MEILYFKVLPSTQNYLVDEIRRSELKPPIAVLAEEQSSGVGSRDNKWRGGDGNFFASIALNLSDLPADLPLASASIYFSFIMKKTLLLLGEDVWLKWPNDFYVDDEKIGGTITKKINDVIVFGIGINLNSSPDGYRALHSGIAPKILLEKYIDELKKFPTWKQIFIDYKVEFELSKVFSTHIDGTIFSLKDAALCDDGSLIFGDRKVYSLR